jgi:hypothetical protein
MEIVAEEWRAVVGRASKFPYEVSSLGRVRHAITKRISGGGCSPHGYRQVGLSLNKEVKRISVHILVAEAFLGPCPKGLEVNHKSGNKADNTPENLEYVTRGENLSHAMRLGLRIIPPAFQELINARKKFNASDLTAIREMLAEGRSERYVAARFGCARTTIRRIRIGRTYT